MVEIIGNAISLGILWAVLAIGVYVTYRMLDIADLSCEGVLAAKKMYMTKVHTQ